jgi:hypothetical protein
MSTQWSPYRLQSLLAAIADPPTPFAALQGLVTLFNARVDETHVRTYLEKCAGLKAVTKLELARAAGGRLVVILTWFRIQDIAVPEWLKTASKVPCIKDAVTLLHSMLQVGGEAGGGASVSDRVDTLLNDRSAQVTGFRPATLAVAATCVAHASAALPELLEACIGAGMTTNDYADVMVAASMQHVHQVSHSWLHVVPVIMPHIEAQGTHNEFAQNVLRKLLMRHHIKGAAEFVQILTRRAIEPEKATWLYTYSLVKVEDSYRATWLPHPAAWSSKHDQWIRRINHFIWHDTAFMTTATVCSPAWVGPAVQIAADGILAMYIDAAVFGDAPPIDEDEEEALVEADAASGAGSEDEAEDEDLAAPPVGAKAYTAPPPRAKTYSQSLFAKADASSGDESLPVSPPRGKTYSAPPEEAGSSSDDESLPAITPRAKAYPAPPVEEDSSSDDGSLPAITPWAKAYPAPPVEADSSSDDEAEDAGSAGASSDGESPLFPRGTKRSRSASIDAVTPNVFSIVHFKPEVERRKREGDECPV